MKNILFLIIILLFGLSFSKIIAQVAINDDGNPAESSAILDINSNEKGVLIPRMTQSERNNIANLVNGLLIFQSDEISGFYYYNGANWSKLGGIGIDLDSGKILIGNSSNLAYDIAISGDATLSNTGVLTINNGVITGAKIAAQTVTQSDLAYNSVGSQQIMNQAVGTSELTYNAVHSANIANGSVTNADIALNAIESDNIIDLSITMVDIADDAINSSKIQANSIVASDIAAASVGQSELKTNSVSSSKILDNSITGYDINTSAEISANKISLSDVLKLIPQSTAPTAPTEGELYVNSNDHHIYCYLNGAWRQLD